MNPAAILKIKNKPVMWLINVVIVLVILLIVYKLYQKIKRDIKGSIRNTQIENDVKDIVTTQGADPDAHVTSNVRTYNDADYKLMAESLFEAMDGAGTDEDSIFSILSSLRTKADWYALVDAFGTRKTSSMWSDFEGTLTKWLSDELSDAEKTRANQILSKFGVARI